MMYVSNNVFDKFLGHALKHDHHQFSRITNPPRDLSHNSYIRPSHLWLRRFFVWENERSDYFENIQALSIFRPLPRGEIGCSEL
jgi:hypothetical protein